MSTSYKVHPHACSECSYSPHSYTIGQRSGGWKFLWQGYLSPMDSPTMAPLTTRADWIAFLKSDVRHVVRDEYDTVIPTQEFIDMALSWDASPTNTRRHKEAHGNNAWQDKDGADFLGSHFD